VTQSDFKSRWANVDNSGRMAAYVDLLNRLRPDDDPKSFPNTMAWIDAQPGERVLEVGCGNGAVARALARHIAVEEIVAVDGSQAMIGAARRQTEGSGLPVTFEAADAQRLPFPDASFDRCYAMELFVILPDPEQAFREMARVTRPGGWLCFWEADCDSHGLLASNTELVRRFLRFVGEREYNGAVGRELVGWCKALGGEVDVTPAVSMDDGGHFLQSELLAEWLADAEAAGVLDRQERDELTSDLSLRVEKGNFFSYMVNLRIRARKPMDVGDT
jgi:ubiquinone/menaquinone biosynthesis C-methylase UbiE